MAPAHGEVCDVAAGRLGEGVHRDEARHRPHPEASATEGGGVPRVEVSLASSRRDRVPIPKHQRQKGSGLPRVEVNPAFLTGSRGGIFVYAGFRVDLFHMATEPVGRFNGTF